MLTVVVIGAIFALTGFGMTPERFAVSFLVFALFGAALMLVVWHGYVRPRIKFDREAKFEEFETLKRRYGMQ